MPFDQLPAKLYDGQTARPWTVYLLLTNDVLQLSGPELPANLPHHWPLTELQLEAVGMAGFLGIRYRQWALESTDENLNRALLKQLRVGGVTARISRWNGAGYGLIITLLVGLLAVMGAGWWWGLPWAAERTVALLPPSFDRELGRRAAEGILRDGQEDAAATHALRDFGRAMQLDSSIRLHVLRSREFNAFALPGGEVFVYSSLADSLRAPGELAALLGHELAHVERRHGTQALARALGGFVLVSALMGDASGMAAVLLDGAQQLGQLNYSRSLEAEADALGSQRLVALGYSPAAMADLFRRLETAQRSPLAKKLEGLEILSDHPNLTARIRAAELLHRTLRPTHAPDPALAMAFAELQAALKNKVNASKP